MEYVYHCSATKGLTELSPRPSTHQIPWVYATNDEAISAMFLGENFDFICQTGIESDGIPYIYEQFPGAFDQAYKDQKGSIYKLSPETFQSGKTHWSPEVVSEVAVPVKEEVDVEDVSGYLRQLEAEGKLKIYMYPSRPDVVPAGKQDIIEKGIKWTVQFGENTLGQLERYHPDVLDTVIRGLKAQSYTFKTPKWQEIAATIN